MLLGLNGQIGAGKDAVYERAAVLAASLGVPAPERVAFADKLKLAAAAALGVDMETLESLKRDDNARIRLSRFTAETADAPADPPNVLHQITVRQYLQYFGTEVGREIFGGSFWVDQALAPDLDHTGRLIIVTDCRFPNEAERVRELGGLVVRVTNGPLNTEGHASEQVLDTDLIDFEIDNSIRGDEWANLDEAVADTLTLLRNGETVTEPHPLVRS
jgi:hypothetical protein